MSISHNWELWLGIVAKLKVKSLRLLLQRLKYYFSKYFKEEKFSNIQNSVDVFIDKYSYKKNVLKKNKHSEI